MFGIDLLIQGRTLSQAYLYAYDPVQTPYWKLFIVIISTAVQVCYQLMMIL